MSPSPDVSAAIARLQSRWGAAAPRQLGESVGAVVGALATAPIAAPILIPREQPFEGIVSTGFAALDAILGPGGLPRSASVAFRGDASSGKTTLALRLAAEAQAAGSIVAWLDLARSFDPVEAVARGIRPEWLVVVTPETFDEGLAIGGALLSGRAVDLLFVDLPTRPNPAVRLKPATSTSRSVSVADRLGRLAALARRSEALLVVLEPPGLASGLATAVAESTAVRLELARRSWIHLGRDVVGQRTEVTVVRNHFGPPGRRAELRILYADGGERDACLVRDELLSDGPLTDGPLNPVPGIRNDATAPSLLAAPPPRSRQTPLRLVPAGADRPRRPSVDGRTGPRRRPLGPRAGRPAGDAARIGASPRARGDLRRSGAGG